MGDACWWSLRKMLAASEEALVVSFNCKLKLAISFRGKQRVRFGDEFQ